MEKSSHILQNLNSSNFIVRLGQNYVKYMFFKITPCPRNPVEVCLPVPKALFSSVLANHDGFIVSLANTWKAQHTLRSLLLT